MLFYSVDLVSDRHNLEHACLAGSGGREFFSRGDPFSPVYGWKNYKGKMDGKQIT
jgi:hypothetical protein